MNYGQLFNDQREFQRRSQVKISAVLFGGRRVVALPVAFNVSWIHAKIRKNQCKTGGIFQRRMKVLKK